MPVKLTVIIAVLLAALAVMVFAADTTPTTHDARRLFGLWRLPHFLVFAGLLVLGAGLFFATRRRETFLAFTSFAVIVVLFSGVLEILGRTGVVSWPALLSPSGYADQEAGWVLLPDFHQSGETYQDIATRYGIPNEPMAFDFATDQTGFRNPAGKSADIILLGDSIVLGAQVERSKTVDAVLERTLDQPVIQAALLGISVQEQHDILLNSGIDLEGKSVIQFMFEGNDLLDSRAWRTRRTGETGETASPASSLVSTLWNLAITATDPASPWNGADYCTIKEQRYLFLWTDRSFKDHMDEVSYIQQSIQDFADTVRQRGGDYFLVFVPTKLRVLGAFCEFPENSVIAETDAHLSTLPVTMKNWSADAGIEFMDLTQALVSATRQGNVPWLWGDTHWAASGHETAAHTLSNWIALTETAD